MKGFLIAFAAIVALTHARPQGVEFTAKDYAAFQAALGDRIPVAIQSAIRVLATVESNPTDFVVLNFNGASGPTARRGQIAAAPAPPGGVAIARTGSIPTDDDVAETFSEVAEEAVEDVQEAAEDAAEEQEEEEEEDAVNRIGLAAEAEEEEQEEVVAVEEMNDVMAQAVVQAIQEEVRRRKRQNNVDNDDDDDEERVLQANTLALAFSGLGSLYAPEAEEEEQEEVVAVEEMNDVMDQAVVQAIQEEVRRRKRQNNVDNDDDDEERVLYANMLKIAFSGLRFLYATTIERYLDDMFRANLKFIERLKDNEKIVLDQVDSALKNPKDKTKRSLSLFVRK